MIGADKIRRQRLDIRTVRQIGIGHDRRRIRIDQNDLITFFAQRFARLRTRIVEFARLPDDDRARADDENFVRCQVSSLGIPFINIEETF